MFPEKHIKDLESSKRRSNYFNNSVIALLFLASFLFLGPLLHEFTHIAVLELKNCTYLFDIAFRLPNGLNATVEPLCAVKPRDLLIFYSGGYFATLTIGVVLNISGSLTSRKFSSHLTALGTGMLISVILTIGVEGDIQNALEVMNLSPSYGGWITLLIIFGVFAASFQGLENLIDLEG